MGGCFGPFLQAQKGNIYFTELAERVEYGKYVFQTASRQLAACRERRECARARSWKEVSIIITNYNTIFSCFIVRVCVYIYIYICTICVYIYIYRYRYRYIDIDIDIDIYTHIIIWTSSQPRGTSVPGARARDDPSGTPRGGDLSSVYTCIHIYIYIYICSCMCMCMCIHMYIYIYIYIYIHMYIHMYTYTYTYNMCI